MPAAIRHLRKQARSMAAALTLLSYGAGLAQAPLALAAGVPIYTTPAQFAERADAIKDYFQQKTDEAMQKRQKACEAIKQQQPKTDDEKKDHDQAVEVCKKAEQALKKQIDQAKQDLEKSLKKGLECVQGADGLLNSSVGEQAAAANSPGRNFADVRLGMLANASNLAQSAGDQYRGACKGAFDEAAKNLESAAGNFDKEAKQFASNDEGMKGRAVALIKAIVNILVPDAYAGGSDGPQTQGAKSACKKCCSSCSGYCTDCQGSEDGSGPCKGGCSGCSGCCGGCGGGCDGCKGNADSAGMDAAGMLAGLAGAAAALQKAKDDDKKKQGQPLNCKTGEAPLSQVCQTDPTVCQKLGTTAPKPNAPGDYCIPDATVNSVKTGTAVAPVATNTATTSTPTATLPTSDSISHDTSTTSGTSTSGDTSTTGTSGTTLDTNPFKQ